LNIFQEATSFNKPMDGWNVISVTFVQSVQWVSPAFSLTATIAASLSFSSPHFMILPHISSWWHNCWSPPSFCHRDLVGKDFTS